MVADGSSVRVPGKVILFGEHAVLFGEPALGLSLSRGIEVKIRPGRGDVTVHPSDETLVPEHDTVLRRMIRRALGRRARTMDVSVRLDIPSAAGFGTSAAVSIALLELRRRIEPLASHQRRQGSLRAVVEEARALESLSHGRSSGLDPALCLSQGLTEYRLIGGTTPRIRHHEPGATIVLVVAARGTHGGTRAGIAQMLDMKKRLPHLADAAMRSLGMATRDGLFALRRGDAKTAGAVSDFAHGILCGLGVVGDDVDEIVRLSRNSGALGAKMTGAGGNGGALVAIAPDQKTAARIVDRLVRAGSTAWIEIVRAQPART